MYATSSSIKEDEEAMLPHSPREKTAEDILKGWGRTLSLLSLRRIARNFFAVLKPSFLSRMAQKQTPIGETASPKKKYTTEYLDGVRGVASLIVFILHWSHNSYPAVNSGWGYKDNTSFWLLPFIRLIFSGAAMVAVFFVVSGFVLTHRFIQRMYKLEHNELYSGLTSLTFRRAIRLYLPSFASSTLAFICVCLGLVSIPSRVDGKRFHHSFNAYLDYLDAECNPWGWDANFFGFYNPQLWSIAVEFRGSMVVFLLVLGLAKTRASVRMIVELFVLIHCFAHKRWDIALFVAGMLLAEVEVWVSRKANLSKTKSINAFLVLTLIVGLYLCGYPRDGATSTPGYMWSQNVWPYTAYRRRFWLAIGAILSVSAIVFMPAAQAFFMTRPARYLGRISFALYLVHGLGNRTVGKWLIQGCWGYIGNESFWPYTWGFVISTTLYFPIVIWASDLFWRVIDVPSTNFARWLELVCSPEAA
ncbi:acyltransferase family-domain-containing protein [Hypoxylon argillaceum]|nr:acyltransferase family-domain-containing protein [Hypoxylon argillaceum]